MYMPVVSTLVMPPDPELGMDFTKACNVDKIVIVSPVDVESHARCEIGSHSDFPQRFPVGFVAHLEKANELTCWRLGYTSAVFNGRLCKVEDVWLVFEMARLLSQLPARILELVECHTATGYGRELGAIGSGSPVVEPVWFVHRIFVDLVADFSRQTGPAPSWLSVCHGVVDGTTQVVVYSDLAFALAGSLSCNGGVASVNGYQCRCLFVYTNTSNS
jgi:hypothetical protein